MLPLAHPLHSMLPLGSLRSPKVKPVPTPAPQRWQPRTFSWWYDAIIDEMLASPQSTKKQIAAKLGIAYATIILITTSDLFRMRFEMRRGLLNDDITAHISHQLSKVASKTLDLTLDVLERKQDSIPLPQLVDLQEKVLTRLGYGLPQREGRDHPQINVNVQQNAPPQTTEVRINASDLASARAALRRNEEVRLIESQVLPPAVAGSAQTVSPLEVSLPVSPHLISESGPLGPERASSSAPRPQSEEDPPGGAALNSEGGSDAPSL